jgi:hypothetical protein
MIKRNSFMESFEITGSFNLSAMASARYFLPFEWYKNHGSGRDGTFPRLKNNAYIHFFPQHLCNGNGICQDCSSRLV